MNFVGRNIEAASWRHFLLHRGVAIVAIFGLPALTFLGFPIKLAQATSIDPWVYCAYITDYADTIARYGMTYFGNRIAFIFVQKPFVAFLGPIQGYLVFRYVALAAGVAAVYSIGNRFYGIVAALVAACWLSLLPWLPRSVFWTYCDGIATIYLLISIALLVAPVRKRLICHGLAGSVFALAVNCNLLLAAIGVTFVPGWIYLNRNQGAKWILLATLAVISGFCAAYLGLGALMHVAAGGRVPFFFDIVAIRLASTLLGGENARWFTPLSEFIFSADYYFLIILPVFFLAVTAVAVRCFRSRLRRAGDLASDLSIFASFHLGLVILLALILHLVFSFGWLHWFFYNIYFFPGCILALICLVGEGTLAANSRLTRQAIYATGALTIALPLLALTSDSFLHAIALVPPTAWYVLGIATIGPLLIRRSVIPASLAIIFAMTLSLSLYANQYYFGLRSHDQEVKQFERDVYDAALFLQRYVNDNVPIHTSLGFWYANRPQFSWLDSVQSMFLWEYSRVASFGSTSPGMPVVDHQFRTSIRGRKALALLAANAAELDAGIAALSTAQIPFNDVKRDAYEGKQISLYVALLSIESRPRPEVMATARAVPLMTMTLGSQAASLQPSASGVAFRSTREPWAYIGRVPLDVGCIKGGGWVAANIRVTHGTVGVGILNRQGDDFVVNTTISGGDNVDTVFLQLDSFAAAGDLVVRNWDENSSAEGVIEAVRIAAGDGATPGACVVQPHSHVVPNLLGPATSLPLQSLQPQNGGSVSQREGSVVLTTPVQQYAFAASAPLVLPERVAGPGVLRVRLQVEQGKLGIGVLATDNAHMLAEQAADVTDAPIDFDIDVGDMSNAGSLVLRSWSPNGVNVRARILSIETLLQRAPSPATAQP